jgi:hypothetical protein
MIEFTVKIRNISNSVQVELSGEARGSDELERKVFNEIINSMIMNGGTIKKSKITPLEEKE